MSPREEISREGGWVATGERIFRDGRGTNVKTNDSGCKAGSRGKAWERKTVTRVVATIRTMTISFYFRSISFPPREERSPFLSSSSLLSWILSSLRPVFSLLFASWI